jgi:hypothetical protein
LPTIHNQTPYAVQWIPLIDKEGANVLAVIAKGTFQFQEPGRLVPAAEQMPIQFKDEFTEAEGKGDLRIPSDLLDFKPATEVVVVRPAMDLEKSPLHGRKVSIVVGPIHLSTRVGNKWDFGLMRRDQKPRRGFAGTYDQKWVDDRMPLLPQDFDARFHLAAAKNQVVAGFLKGNELVQLTNLFEDGKILQAVLPGMALIVAAQSRYAFTTDVAKLDTVLVWTDVPHVTLIWRHCVRPRQKIEEVGHVFVYQTRLKTARELFGGP